MKNSDSNEFKIKNHIILSFGDDNNEDLLKIIEKNGTIYYPRFIFVTKNEGNYTFMKKNYISNIVYSGMEDIEIVNNIISELWEIDCYYNERGNEICSYMPNNIEKDMELNNLSINLFLTGIARSGKSTFTNKINDNKLLALESCDKSSVTTKVSEYKIIGERKSDKDGFIKIIDTPGFNYEKDKKKVSLTNIDKINENIKNAIEDYKNRNNGDDIHFILFFFNEGTTLQGIENILSLFQEENYTVLFIINRSIDESDIDKYGNPCSSDIKSTINFLNSKGLGKLAEEDNIICCNLIKSQKVNCYGLNNIFKRILEILNSKNPFLQNKELLRKLKECEANIDRLKDTEYKTEYEKFLNESKKYKKEIPNDNSLFKKYIGGDDAIIEECKKKANRDKNICYSLTTASVWIPIPYSDLAGTPFFQAIMLYSILNDYGIPILDLDSEDLLYIILGREIGHLMYNQVSKKLFEKTSKGCIMAFAKALSENQSKKVVSESLKIFPVVGYAIGSAVGNVLNYFSTNFLADNCIKFCEYYTRFHSGLKFWINQIEIFGNIVKDIEKLKNKENWNNYNVKIMKSNNNQ